MNPSHLVGTVTCSVPDTEKRISLDVFFDPCKEDPFTTPLIKLNRIAKRLYQLLETAGCDGVSININPVDRTDITKMC